MQEILLNLANIMLLDYCKTMKINPSNSFVRKEGRGFKYSICDYPTGKPFAQVTFNKSQVPTFNMVEILSTSRSPF